MPGDRGRRGRSLAAGSDRSAFMPGRGPRTGRRRRATEERAPALRRERCRGLRATTSTEIRALRRESDGPMGRAGVRAYPTPARSNAVFPARCRVPTPRQALSTSQKTGSSDVDRTRSTPPRGPHARRVDLVVRRRRQRPKGQVSGVNAFNLLFEHAMTAAGALLVLAAAVAAVLTR